MSLTTKPMFLDSTGINGIGITLLMSLGRAISGRIVPFNYEEFNRLLLKMVGFDWVKMVE